MAQPLHTSHLPTRLYTPQGTQAQHWQDQHHASWLNAITTTPQAIWLTTPEHAPTLHTAALDATKRNELLVAVAYHLPNLDGCGGGAATAEKYREYIGVLTEALAPTKALIIVEPDSIALDHFDATRAQLLHEAVHILTAQGHLVFLDAGHSRWHSVESIAPRLQDSGIDTAAGFSLNVANRMDNTSLIDYGTRLSETLGGKTFVIDTGRNGAGPHVNEDGHVVWCNARGEGLGRQPQLLHDGAHLANLWIKCPGESDGFSDDPSSYGSCPAGAFSPHLAATLIQNSPYVDLARKNLHELRKHQPSS